MRPVQSSLGMLGLCVLSVIGAASGEAAAPDVTVLRLSVTGTVQETPDLLVALLVAQSDAAGPAAAQRQVNARMQAAGRLADAVPSVRWRLDGYGVDRTGDRPPAWTARQTLRLDGTDAGALLDLAGRLQAMGLAIGELSWTLSPPHLAAAQARAADQALRALRIKAAAAAGSLGLKVGLLRDVTLGNGAAPIHPMMRAMAAPPQATQDAQEISADASAEIELHP